jgi:hypothetical protein
VVSEEATKARAAPFGGKSVAIGLVHGDGVRSFLVCCTDGEGVTTGIGTTLEPPTRRHGVDPLLGRSVGVMVEGLVLGVFGVLICGLANRRSHTGSLSGLAVWITGFFSETSLV